MFSKSLIALLLAADGALAFPWVAKQEGVDTSLLHTGYAKRQQPGEGAADPATCPFNANHVPAAKVNAKFP